MTLESGHFLRRRPDPARLETYGFQKRGGVYRLTKEFMDGFRAELIVSREGEVSGRVLDSETGEEYLPLRAVEACGAFVGEVRAAYGAFLDEIAAACFVTAPFLSPQSDRLQVALAERFGDVPDFPFAKCPGYGVFRFPGNGKWYGLIMAIPRARLEKGAPEEPVEIVNLKVAPEDREKLLEKDGVYPCYHMNRAHWVTVALDGRLADEEILALLAASRALVAKGAGRRAGENGSTGPASWIVPANPLQYDVETGFWANGGRLDWTQTARVCPGDEVFIYLGAPISSVRFGCVVLAADLPDPQRPGKKRMTIECRAMFPPRRFTMSWLRKGGVKSVRSARHLPASLADELRAAAAKSGWKKAPRGRKTQ